MDTHTGPELNPVASSLSSYVTMWSVFLPDFHMKKYVHDSEVDIFVAWKELHVTCIYARRYRGERGGTYIHGKVHCGTCCN